MRLVDGSKLLELQNTPVNIRNICIVAHVDHGKTTLADSLISSNGIISQRMSGKLRYMDSRPDEQERGITMKSSSIALYHAVQKQEYLVNLIDSPGHVDFSSEVSTAVRLCDGAIVVVDVVEGVCPQTRLALKQAYSENIRAVLVLNKIDRLILEMQMTPLDAYVHLTQVMEQVNAVMGELFASEVLGNEETKIEKQETKEKPKEDNNFYDWTSALEDADDSNLYFSPEQGNVVFASAIDGWGFTVHTFARLFSEKLGVKEEILRKVLWGDFYLNTKTKRFMKGAQEKAKKPLFVQVVLDNLWNVYETIAMRNEKEKVPVICEKLGIKLTTRDLRHTDSRIQLQSLMMQWLPLSQTVLNMVCTKLPSPKEIGLEKVEKLMCTKICDYESLHPQTQALRNDFLACDSSSERPVIVYISKMFSVDKSVLPENKPKALTAEEMALRRERARQMREQMKLNEVNSQAIPMTEENKDENTQETSNETEKEDNQPAFIAFARVFSGRLRKGDKVYVLGPKHDPSRILNIKDYEVDPNKKLKDLKSDEHITCADIKSLYILMGRELEEIDEAVAGNIIGIGGLEEHVLKTATLSTTIACPAFSELQSAAVPILRVALEPANPSQLPQLVKGLKLLNQSDSCVQVLLQETGEHVIVTAGEVHLERCLEDLKNNYAKIPITVSEPIVPFRETIIEPPKIDMANEEIDSQNIDKENDTEVDPVITVLTNNKQSRIKIRARPLPNEITVHLDKSTDLLKAISQHIKSLQGSPKNEKIENKLDNLHINGTHELSDRMLKLIETFIEELKNISSKLGPEWSNVAEQIWSVGPRNCGPNLLLNQTTDYNTKFLYHKNELKEDPRFEYESSFVNGFQLASLAGPLCEEPMMGVAFCVEEWSLDKSEGEDVGHTFGPLSGQIMSAVKDGCRKAFQVQPQRLMAAMYSCDIVVDQKVLGKLYAALGRRGGRVVGSDLQTGSASFRVQALMPVAESFKFALELRTHTSGLAAPQLLFSHWEVIEIDPFWRPRTEEEYLQWGEKWDGVNRAKAYMDAVRARKGLATDKHLVQHAEKQRTLSKKK
ncbi:elongation factor-like GTPase 1 isoform X1 [Cydia pomonella]|uniref:elongation factor-like GTPase 1 isoform X1 n=2 Tax=Cydia pomonella TaxID=82600 RepID=UPI002ADE6352|nr:elongation factor-like GTPase 1 isoform X1 [Cydia pomonella]